MPLAIAAPVLGFLINLEPARILPQAIAMLVGSLALSLLASLGAAVTLGIRQIAVPQSLHERLWVIKYTAFVGILALSFYSMHDALIVAEVEPFKTAISLRMWRAWPFIAFVLALLAASLFIERFYCRYLCPLGAGLAIPAKLKIFDWLKRRPQCGREPHGVH